MNDGDVMDEREEFYPQITQMTQITKPASDF